ncbi:MAG: hypothetical protein AAES65_05065 [Candidatus Thiodiazotropha sp. (ex. Lucinoma kazani)]
MTPLALALYATFLEAIQDLHFNHFEIEGLNITEGFWSFKNR